VREETSERIRKNLWVGYLGALIVWAGLAYNLMAEEYGKGKLFAYEENGKPFISDFVNIYNAAVLARECEKRHIAIYDPEVQSASSAVITAPIKAEQPFYLQVAPFFFSLVRPLAELPIAQAWMLWCGGAIIALVLALRTLIGQSIQGKFSCVFALVATLAAFPEWEGVRSGNTSLWLAPGIIYAWCLMQSAPIRAALATSVCLIKFQYLPLMGLVGLMRGRFKFVATLMVVTLALVALAIATVGMDNVMDFPQALLSGERSTQLSGVSADKMQNLRGELVLLFGSDGSIAHIGSLIGLILSIVAVLIMWMKPAINDDNSHSFRLKASITTLLLLAFSPHTHKHDYVIAVVPAVWIWSYFKYKSLIAETSSKQPKLQTLGLFLIASFPFFSWIFFMLDPVFHLIKIQPFFAWACLLAFVAARELCARAGGSGAHTTDSER
jgi:hypothetical protein